jgi:hypothetical protein
VASARVANRLVIGVCVLSAPGIWHAHERYRWGFEFWAIAAVIFGVMVATMLGYLHGRARVGEAWPVGKARKRWMGLFTAPRFIPKPEAGPLEEWTRPLGGQTDLPALANRWWSRPVPVVVGAALAAAAAVPAAAAYWTVAELPPAVICLRAVDGVYPEPIDGVLVGQTSDRVYLGDRAPDQRVKDPPPRALTTLSADVVDRVIVRGTDHSQCHVPRPKPGEGASNMLSAGAINQLLGTYDRVWRRHHAAHLRARERHRAVRPATP